MYRIMIFMMLGVLLAACQDNGEQQTSSDAETTPTFSGLNSLPTLPGYVEPPKPTLPVDISQFPIAPDPAGQELYETHCADCHGINGEGQYPDDPYGVNEEGLLGAPPHTNNGHTWHHPDPVLFEIIYNGQEASGFLPMPAFKEQLSPDEIVSILAYIKMWWGEQELDAQ
ncbi:MAG: c-type cytochrome, partial [Anaerolineae bacterium]|nr:c-type cytochrome [Anaerolineae bacterium]